VIAERPPCWYVHTSRAYAHFLTPQQVQARFGATDAQQAAIASWLTSFGLTVDRHDPNVVTATGSTAQAEAVASAPAPPVVKSVFLGSPAPDFARLLAGTY
jgi:hypothetical protein